ncbi:hypothetical protein OAU52_01105 [bacterium]|nr:hypothetical protein [bacterium]
MKNLYIFALIIFGFISSSYSKGLSNSHYPNLTGEFEVSASFGFGAALSGEQLDFAESINDSSHLSSEWGINLGYFFHPFLGTRVMVSQRHLSHNREYQPEGYQEGDDLEYEKSYIAQGWTTRLGGVVAPLFTNGLKGSVYGIEVDLGLLYHAGKPIAQTELLEAFSGVGYYVYPKISYKGELVLLNLGFDFQHALLEAEKSSESFNYMDLKVGLEVGLRF